MNTFFVRCLAVCVCVLSFPFGVVSALEQGEGIVLDTVTGNYLFTYFDELEDGSKVLIHGTFFPATKISPSIKSIFHSNRTVAVIYSYVVSSGVQSRQVLDTIRFDLFARVVGSQDLPFNYQSANEEQIDAVLEANKLALSTPRGWDGFISTNQSGASRITWNPTKLGAGIHPGESQQGFGFVSQNLPGMGVSEFEGVRDGRNGFSGDGPDPSSDISKQIQKLYQNDFVTHNAAVPTIAIPDPFDAAVTLERIQNHMHTWIDKQLLDPVFSSQLDRSFQSAISAYRLNQPRVGKQEIQSMRKLIEKEQPDLGRDEEHESEKSHEKHDDRKTALIDRLAARVLDFDLAYVTKRMADDEGEHKSARRHDR
jgi:hypothetical protein